MVVLSTEHWDAKRQARKELLYKSLVEGGSLESLLYVEPMTLWWRQGALPVRDRMFAEQVRVCRWKCPLPGERFPLIQSLNRRWQMRRIARCMEAGTFYQGIFYHPANWLVARELSRQAYWYFDWTEDWGLYQQSSHIAILQERAIREADGVIAVCESLYERACTLRGSDKDVLLLPNATALSTQPSGQPESAELALIPRPRIGLMGHMGPWMDVGLVAELARARPAWQWCILGDARGEERRLLQALPNIHLLGIHPYLQLPAFMQHMDVLVAPYKHETQGDSSKLYDYLTSGKPVIASAMDTSRRLQGGVAVASTMEGWLQQIEEALAGDDEASADTRRQLASQATWEARSEQLLAWLNSRK